ncbi:MAG: hypothetical protein ACI9SC_001849 [Gammaproteobacteria bacterium]|jgi:hypothetical protein
MTSDELDNLVKIGSLKKEAGVQTEFDGLVNSGRKRLDDAHKESNSPESRFDLAYNAAHSLSLAALRWQGYRSTNRYMVFQALAHTLRIDSATWRVLAKAHERRNLAEYEGHYEIDERLLKDLITSTEAVYVAVSSLGAVSSI